MELGAEVFGGNCFPSGVYAHLSALKGGETLKIPTFSL